MAISEELVRAVVADVSERMKDPAYTQLAVGNFVECQPQLSRYLSSKAARLGGAHVLVQLVFHAELLCECLRRARGGEPAEVDFAALDRACQGDVTARFSALEPALADYVGANVDEAGLCLELCRIGMSLCEAGLRRV